MWAKHRRDRRKYLIELREKFTRGDRRAWNGKGNSSGRCVWRCVSLSHGQEDPPSGWADTSSAWSADGGLPALPVSPHRPSGLHLPSTLLVRRHVGKWWEWEGERGKWEAWRMRRRRGRWGRTDGRQRRGPQESAAESALIPGPPRHPRHSAGRWTHALGEST